MLAVSATAALVVLFPICRSGWLALQIAPFDCSALSQDADRAPRSDGHLALLVASVIVGFVREERNLVGPVILP
jgi:hypothetical protein